MPLEALGLPGRTGQRSSLLSATSCAFSDAELQRLNSFNYKLIELAEEEGQARLSPAKC